MHASEISNTCGNGEVDMSSSSRTAVSTTEDKRFGWIVTRHRVESVVLCFIITTVCMLLLLPVIVYHLPAGVQQSGERGVLDPVNEACSPNVTYTGSSCIDALLDFQNCLPDEQRSDNIYITLMEHEEQQDVEIQYQQLQLELDLLNPSQECKKAVTSLLCLYLFRLCDSTGRVHQPSHNQCTYISTDVCAREWREATEILGSGVVPSCESFPAVSLMCSEHNGTTNATYMNATGNLNADSECNIGCRDDFYKDSEMCTCRPRCDRWKPLTHSMVVTLDVTVIISASVGLLAGTAVLVFSLIRRKHMFTFPSVFIVYLTITAVILSIITLISYTDRAGLFCNSPDLIESMENETHFCNITGIVFYYALLQIAVWWLLHVAAIFWGIKFPFRAKSLAASNRQKYLHIFMVLLGLILPIIPVITTLARGGFVFTPILCIGRKDNATFYSLILPMIILMQIGISMLIIIFWTVHKRDGVFRMRGPSIPRANSKMGTVKKKILIILCYDILLGVVAITAFTFAARSKPIIDAISHYYLCEAPGIDPDNPCDRSAFENQIHYPILFGIAYLLLGLLPASKLIFVVDICELKQWYRQHPCRSVSIS